jgi:uncharacterized protein
MDFNLNNSFKGAMAMRKYSVCLILLFLLIFLVSCSQNNIISKLSSSNTSSEKSENTLQNNLTALAKQFITYLSKEDYKNAVTNFDSIMKAQLSEEKLKETWKSLILQSGSFKKQVNTRAEKVEVYDVIYVTCEFEKVTLDVKVVFNSSKQISGLFFIPSQSTNNSNTTLKDTSMPDSITEKDINVCSGEWILPGTLTLPKGKGHYPVVILVHGSGPNDRDETIGVNKPFKDIAWGLATHGIAVLRYEKRTKQYASKLSKDNNITVKEEAIDDVLSAISLMSNTDNIDKTNIFVLGHSLGGMLLPQIGSLNSNIKGLIFLAASSRPLEDLILEQTEYILSLDKSLSQKDKENQINQVKAQVEKIKDPKLSASTSANELLGVPAKYWLNLREYNPLKTAEILKQPMFFLQGERDYQVTLKDFELWKTALSNKQNVAFKLYSNLNHLFIDGKGKSTPQEYSNPGQVSDNVINDISNWIKSKS